MRELPTGTVTLLFTDIEGSTRLLHELGERYPDVLAQHRRVLRDAFGRHGGVEVDTQGDAFFYAFTSATDAVAAAAEAQAALADGPVRVRMGVHTGEPIQTDEGYVGLDVHAAARIMGAGHGGQVLFSGATGAALKASNSLLLTDLGEHRLKDIEGPVPIFQLGDDAFPPLKTISNTNLPRPASSFVGRAKELEEVLALLRQDSVRLLTLTGPGGSGKTRLAIEAAAELAGDYRSGVFWVGLAPLHDSALVTETIAQTLGAKDGLAEHVGERELLLLLDNLEQVVEAAPELSALLERCPNLVLLATSRELLRVRGEVEYEVPPLAQPEAVELFCERARGDPTAEIEELCARLDNLPLAVELAAARTKVLTPAQILQRLAQRFDLLKGGRDADPRQQTLRATIKWSYDLLSAEEQQLFRRLSVFAGGCTLEAAQEVAEADLDSLQSLVEKSLVRFSEGRFWMLETIREYAAERLGRSEGGDETAIRHSAFFARLAEDAEPRIAAERIDIGLAEEEDNIRSALSFCADGREPELMLRLAAAVWLFWYRREQHEEARRWLEEAVRHADTHPSPVRARALRGLGALTRDDLGRAREIEEEALKLYLELGDADGIARCLNNLGLIAVEQGDFHRAAELFTDSMAHGADVGPLGGLGKIALRVGDLDKARRMYEQRLAAADADENHRFVAASHIELAWIAAFDDRLDDAARHAGECLPIARRLGVTLLVAESVLVAGLVRACEGEVVAAARLVGAAERQRQRLGQPPIRDSMFGRLFAALEQDLGVEPFAAACAKGAAQPFDEAVEQASRALD